LRGWETGSPFVGTEWVRVENSISAVPTSGSIIFFDKTKTNSYGHVAVVDSADADLIILVEQNAGSGNGNGIGANAITRRTVGYTARA
jgi:surface antigen